MSIYPVRLSEWYPLGDDNHDITFIIVKHSRCYACGSRIRWKAAVGHHAIPYGYGDTWCSWKCCKSGKVAKLDKRRERRLKRRENKDDKCLNALITLKLKN